MHIEAKKQIIDFLNYLENTGQVSSKESEKLIKSMESPLEKMHKDLPQILTRREVADMLKVSPGFLMPKF